MGDHHSDHSSRTRYLRPIDNIAFTVPEMMAGILSTVSPASITSINQLHGDRKSVVRITCKTAEATKELDTKIASRRVQINGVRLARVTDSGHFVRLTLADIPQYLTTADLERELSIFGNVVHIRREYVEYQGYRVENEMRHVLMTSLLRDVPQRIMIEGQEVFVTSKQVYGTRDSSSRSRNSTPPIDPEPVIQEPNYIPKHVMNAMHHSTTDNLRRRQAARAPDTPDTGSGTEQEPNAGSEVESTQVTPSSNRRTCNAGTNTPSVLSPAIHRKIHIASIEKCTENQPADAPGGALHRETEDESNDQQKCRPGQLYSAYNGNRASVMAPRGMERRHSIDCNPERDPEDKHQERFEMRSKTPDPETHI